MLLREGVFKLPRFGCSVLVCLLAAPVATAAVYKCEIDGHISYLEQPCPADSVQHELQVTDDVGFSDEGSVRGSVSLDDDAMPVNGAVGVWYEDTRELWIYLFPFPVDEDIRDAMLSSRGNGHQFRAHESLNPDPARWRQTPFVLFQFLFDNARRRLDSLRHARFVSWQARVPTTINFSADEAAKKQHFEQLRVTESGMVVFSGASSDTFAERLYTWNVRAQIPLMTFETR